MGTRITPNTDSFYAVLVYKYIINLLELWDDFANVLKHISEAVTFLNSTSGKLCIQPKCGKIRTRENFKFGHFSHSVRKWYFILPLYPFYSLETRISNSLYPERKLNRHKTFKRHRRCILDVLRTLNLCPVSRG